MRFLQARWVAACAATLSSVLILSSQQGAVAVSPTPSKDDQITASTDSSRMSSRGEVRSGVLVKNARTTNGGRRISATVHWDPKLFRASGKSRFTVRVVALHSNVPTVLASRITGKKKLQQKVTFNLSSKKAAVVRSTANVVFSASQQWGKHRSKWFTKNFVSVVRIPKSKKRAAVRANVATRDCGRIMLRAGATARNCNFVGANLSGAYLPRANFRGSNFADSLLQNANLRNANLSQARVTGARVSGAQFAGANTSGSSGKVVGKPANGPTPGGGSKPKPPKPPTPPQPTVPGAPTSVQAVPGNAQAEVSWTAPASDGGTAITSYTATAVADGETTRTCTSNTGDPITPSCTIVDLVNGVEYSVTVTAHNVKGDSPASSPAATVTPATVPGAPIAVQATAGNAQADISWTAPTSDGGSAIDSYTATAMADGETTRTCTSNTGDPITPSCTIVDLVNGVEYSVTVTAHNVKGHSAASSPAATVTPEFDCASGGECSVGDTGPGGGKVFYVAGSPQSWGQYLEAAPADWDGGGSDPQDAWCYPYNTLLSGTFGTAIGAGESNTDLMLAGCSSGAGEYARSYHGGGQDDWSLPSKDELNQMYLQKDIVGGLNTSFPPAAYYSSTQIDATNAWVQKMSDGTQMAGDKEDFNTYWEFRPTRAFGPVAPCAEGGPCQIGDTGPGGGKVFYVAGSPQFWGRYLEAAPSTWSSPAGDPNLMWGINECQESGGGTTSTAIGTGRTNTAAIMAACTSGANSPAATAAHDYAGGGQTDWYLPSLDELAAMYDEVDLIEARDDDAYWSSSNVSGAKAYIKEFWTGDGYPDYKEINWLVRPIRAFG